MRITYPAKNVHTEEVENPHLLVADHGSYIFLGAEENTSAFNGVALLDLHSYIQHKVVHDIKILGATPKELIVNPEGVVRVTEKGDERWFFQDRLACYAAKTQQPITILLDARDVYDTRTDGRQHHVELVGERPWVVHVRSRDTEAYLVSSVPVSVCDEWVEKSTPYDARRGGADSWWVYDGVTLHPEGEARLVVCDAKRITEARTVIEAGTVWEEQDGVWDDLDAAIAYQSLHGCITRTPSGEAGILAGIPWFFQIYARDEAIATGALLAREEFHLAARILLRQISVILDDGRIPNRFPYSARGSADGVGWAFLRLDELRERGGWALSSEQWVFVQQQLLLSLSRLRHDPATGLVMNAAQETWMDTTGGTPDTRDGARIEIQALTLRQYRLAAALAEHTGLGDSEQLRKQERALADATKEQFFHPGNKLLADGVNGVPDVTVRPNVFIALYAYPWLLTKEEWCAVIDNALPRLQASWEGGLTSIDTSDPYFVATHTGFDDRSYHRGDVWYFLSNIAAIAAFRLDERYRGFAKSVYAASKKDLLALGATGQCSEISSASTQEPLGCWCQAWSASTFVELSLLLRE